MTTTADADTLVDSDSPKRGQRAARSPRSRNRADARSGTGIVREPRIDLLPIEVHVFRRERAAVRRAWLGVVAVAAVVALGIGAAAAGSMTARADLVSAQGEASALLSQQGRYSEVRTVESQTALLEAAQKVGGSTEIDWSTYLASVQASLPGAVQIDSVTVDSASPITEFAQATGPLQGQRVATIALVASSPTLPSVPDWLDSVRSLKGYVDATAQTVTLSSDAADVGYTVNMTIHVNEDAYDHRYTEDGK